MIILYSKKINKNFKEQIADYLDTTNFCNLECPHCHSHNLIKWGYYERNVIFFSSDKITIENMILKVQRIRCKSCGTTHALLPFGIVPYKQFTDEIISKIFLELICDNLENISGKYQIDQSIIKNWCNQYDKYHNSKVNTLIKHHNKKQSLKIFLSNCNNKIDYIKTYCKCFMQIKLGCLWLCPS